MDTSTTDSWNNLESKIQEYFFAEKNKKLNRLNRFYYRGHSKKAFLLETTLERKIKQQDINSKEYLINKYLREIRIAKNEIESILGKKWNIQDEADTERPSFDILTTETLEYMVYLRHHGYPSPLLDWTISPYIAAFFACRENKDKDGAIIIFDNPLNKPGIPLAYCANIPFIASTVGPNLRTNERHYRQQADYTLACCHTRDEWYFANHEDAASNPPKDFSKIIIPAQLKNDFMSRLNLMNINEYTLFGTEDAFIKSLSEKANF